jgi:hypothetical protein
MDLLNASGTQVQSVQFAHGERVYAAPSSGALALTTNAMTPGNLPTMFIH